MVLCDFRVFKKCSPNTKVHQSVSVAPIMIAAACVLSVQRARYFKYMHIKLCLLKQHQFECFRLHCSAATLCTEKKSFAHFEETPHVHSLIHKLQHLLLLL